MRDRGLRSEAADAFTDATALGSGSTPAWLLLGNLCVARREWGLAQGRFEKVLKAINKRDHYAIVSLGNIYSSSIGIKPEKREKYLKIAEERYTQVCCIATHTHAHAHTHTGPPC